MSVRTFRSIAEVVEETGFSRNFINTEIARGNLQSCKVGRRRVISHGAFAAWTRGKPAEAVQPENALIERIRTLELRMAEIGHDLSGIRAGLEEREHHLRESLR